MLRIELNVIPCIMFLIRKQLLKIQKLMMVKKMNQNMPR